MRKPMTYEYVDEEGFSNWMEQYVEVDLYDFDDDELVAELERRGYKVSKELTENKDRKRENRRF
jgi:hypothetical protein